MIMDPHDIDLINLLEQYIEHYSCLMPSIWICWSINMDINSPLDKS
jgi:hypothetical protein